jgi:peptide/nickel transport system substrate-binding protein
MSGKIAPSKGKNCRALEGGAMNIVTTSRKRMSRRNFVAGAAGSAIGAAAIAAGCGKGKSGAGSAGSSRPSNAGIKRGGTLTGFSIAPPGGRFEVAGVASEQPAGQLRSSLIYNGLLRLKVGAGVPFTDQTLEGALAGGWEQPDPQTLVFHLRPGVKFHNKPPVNGRALTSADVQFSLSRLLASPFAYQSFYSSIAGIDTPDPQTVVLRLRAPDAALLLHLGIGYAWVIAKEAGQADAKSAAGLDFHDPATAIGTGPFMLESDEDRSQTTFARNPSYFEDSWPYVDRVIWRWITDASSEVASLQSGQSMLGTLPMGSEADFRTRNPKFSFGTQYDTRVWHHAMRVDQAPFNDVRVRRALALAFDQAEVRKIWGYPDAPFSDGSLIASAGDAYLAPEKLGENAQWWKTDVAQAKQLMAAAGFGQGFEADYNYPLGIEPSLLPEQLSSNLAKIGVKLNIKGKELGVHLATTARGQYSGLAGLQLQMFDPGDWFTAALLPDSSKNVSHVNDSKVTDLVNKQQTELDHQKRLDIIHELVRYLGGQVYQLVLPQAETTQTWQPFVKNYSPRPGFQPSLAVAWLDK